VFCSLAEFLAGRSRTLPSPGRARVVSALAFLYTIVAVAGAGADIVYWGFLLLLAGLPVYVWR
jgi:hypothetical protein